MKLKVIFKTPDVVETALLSIPPTAYDDRLAARAVFEKFLKWDELLTVEFDTVAQTATVLSVQQFSQ